MRIKKSSQYGWGSANHDLVGTVQSIDGDGDCNVNFRGQSNWIAFGKLVLTEAVIRLKVGDKVILTDNFEEFGDASDGPLTRAMSERLSG